MFSLMKITLVDMPKSFTCLLLFVAFICCIQMCIDGLYMMISVVTRMTWIFTMRTLKWFLILDGLSNQKLGVKGRREALDFRKQICISDHRIWASWGHWTDGSAVVSAKFNSIHIFGHIKTSVLVITDTKFVQIYQLCLWRFLVINTLVNLILTSDKGRVGLLL